MFEILELIIAILLAVLPVIVWGYIFYSKQPENKRLTALTFICGALAVFPILFYKYLWQFFPWINVFKIAEPFTNQMIGIAEILSVPLSVIITFMLVGVIEEFMKLFAVKIIDDKKFKSIDDAMEYFVIAALGFSFTENILYFYNILITQSSGDILIPFIFRSSFSTFAHILFSGVLGYYYGIAHFAKPMLQQEIVKNRMHWTIILHKIFNIRKEKMFHQEKMLEGVLLAVGLHALFNIFLEINISFMMAPFLLIGYVSLNYLFNKAENHKNLRKLLEGERNHTQTIPETNQ